MRRIALFMLSPIISHGMKRIAFVTLLAVGLLGPTACSVNQAFVKGVESYSEAILPEYEEYVKKDSTMSEEDVSIRLDSANGLKNLIKEAKEEK